MRTETAEKDPEVFSKEMGPQKRWCWTEKVGSFLKHKSEGRDTIFNGKNMGMVVRQNDMMDLTEGEKAHPLC